MFVVISISLISDSFSCIALLILKILLSITKSFNDSTLTSTAITPFRVKIETGPTDVVSFAAFSAASSAADRGKQF